MQTTAINNTRVTIMGSEVSVVLSFSLKPNTNYSVQIDTNSFVGVSYAFPGFVKSDGTLWTFKTAPGVLCSQPVLLV